jgi:hypothetical protein
MIIIIQFNLRTKIDNHVIMVCSGCYYRLSRTCENMNWEVWNCQGLGDDIDLYVFLHTR